MAAQASIFPESAPAPSAVALARIVVAYDGSASADEALKDAALLAGRHRSEVLIVHVEQPAFSRESPACLSNASHHLAGSGVRHRGIRRLGSTGEMLLRVCGEEEADLLMMGAYGFGKQDRETLGSTAERLLRVAPCPVFTYGPKTHRSVLDGEQTGPVLFPIAFPCNDAQVPQAIKLAKLFRCAVEVFSAVPYPTRRIVQWLEAESLRVAGKFRAQGIRTSWSFVYGAPDLAIWNKSVELKSPFILMPLRQRESLSASTSDNVAAHVIRHAQMPVLSYRFN